MLQYPAMSGGVAAIVLAAGESSRMGRPKPLLPLDGETFLSHLLGQIQDSRVTNTIVVLGHNPEVVLSAMPQIESRAVVNTNYTLGQLSSLHVGLERAGDVDAILMFLADHPFISTEVIDSLIAAHEATGRPIVVPTHSGRRGHPTLFARSVLGELRNAPLDQGARVVVRAHAAELLEVPTTDPGVIADVDTPEQYEEWLGYWRANRPATPERHMP
jgi:molybdenum cofactor cytidylyltransferase